MGIASRLKRAFRPMLAGSVAGMILTFLPGRRRSRGLHEAGLGAFSTAPCGERSAVELEQDLDERADPRAGRTPTEPGSS